MTTIDERQRENSQQNDGDPMTTFTAVNMSRQRNAEPTALHDAADTERLRAAVTPRKAQASQTHRAVGFGRGLR